MYIIFIYFNYVYIIYNFYTYNFFELCDFSSVVWHCICNVAPELGLVVFKTETALLLIVSVWCQLPVYPPSLFNYVEYQRTENLVVWGRVTLKESLVNAFFYGVLR